MPDSRDFLLPTSTPFRSMDQIVTTFISSLFLTCVTLLRTRLPVDLFLLTHFPFARDEFHSPLLRAHTVVVLASCIAVCLPIECFRSPRPRRNIEPAARLESYCAPSDSGSFDHSQTTAGTTLEDLQQHRASRLASLQLPAPRPRPYSAWQTRGD